QVQAEVVADGQVQDVVGLGLKLDLLGKAAVGVEEGLLGQPAGETADAHRAAVAHLRGAGAADAPGHGVPHVADVDRAGAVQLQVVGLVGVAEFQVEVGQQAGGAPGHGKDKPGSVRRGAHGGAVGDAKVRLVQQRLRAAGVLGQRLV